MERAMGCSLAGHLAVLPGEDDRPYRPRPETLWFSASPTPNLPALHGVSAPGRNKGGSGAFFLSQGTGSNKNNPLLLRAKGSHVLALFPQFSSWLLGSSSTFSSKMT